MQSPAIYTSASIEPHALARRTTIIFGRGALRHCRRNHVGDQLRNTLYVIYLVAVAANRWRIWTTQEPSSQAALQQAPVPSGAAGRTGGSCTTCISGGCQPPVGCAVRPGPAVRRGSVQPAGRLDFISVGGIAFHRRRPVARPCALPCHATNVVWQQLSKHNEDRNLRSFVLLQSCRR